MVLLAAAFFFGLLCTVAGSAPVSLRVSFALATDACRGGHQVDDRRGLAVLGLRLDHPVQGVLEAAGAVDDYGHSGFRQPGGAAALQPERRGGS
ncbi:hypothetical protein [Streptomyces sp. NPDC051909]|uniref:hypothetical protein n=1 Tax=Streptomyces sp. NPDC051909 TaxID=3154944 RepID=UPI00342B29CF